MWSCVALHSRGIWYCAWCAMNRTWGPRLFTHLPRLIVSNGVLRWVENLRLNDSCFVFVVCFLCEASYAIQSTVRHLFLSWTILLVWITRVTTSCLSLKEHLPYKSNASFVLSYVLQDSAGSYHRFLFGRSMSSAYCSGLGFFDVNCCGLSAWNVKGGSLGSQAKECPDLVSFDSQSRFRFNRVDAL